MSVRETILRHKIVINKLRHRPLSWSEIDRILQEQSALLEYNLTVSQRQFQRDIADISALYGISIESNRSKKQYFIQQDTEEAERALDAFDVFNLMRLGNNGSKQIIFEQRKPRGTEYLGDIVHALHNGRALYFDYSKYYETEVEHRRLYPILLKEVRNRWYVIGQDLDKDSLRIFPLDRILSLEVVKAGKFKAIKVDPETLFEHSFGIILPREDQHIEEVILSYSAFQGKYIKSLPLHHTQEIVVDNEEELRVKLTIYITHDFVMELLSVGAEVKVIAPESLADRMKEEYRKSLQHQS
ncbi:WYL domain-containing protein [Sphingobacterium siyangense]|uniref:helix-turn-helix transcriptional regulator n=1 Tax=Sphingobacterium siyangense TaxID=459529 RepID=UPI00200FEE9C|nr:WYL domain-containing protein [Sphingobacterium siyangense]UQA76704.1 WYL domain-containing protein [Sphingobacterium siyangense]